MDMLKLRHVHITPQVSFQVDSNRLQNSAFLLENLRSLSKVRVSCSDSKWLTKLTRLQRLCCVFVDDLKDNQFRMLRFNDHLTSLKVENEAGRCGVNCSYQLVTNGMWVMVNFKVEGLEIAGSMYCWADCLDDSFPSPSRNYGWINGKYSQQTKTDLKKEKRKLETIGSYVP
ncbi:hypothetical protein Leryth_026982 [Lithospermum erythrorhizon]|nr:hypothetical protein Leryth_026982 [Lithospermum erythrorhizon]